MPCVTLPSFPPLPSLGPFSLTPPALPALDLSVNFCCRLNLLIVPPLIPLGPLVLAIPGSAAIIAGINTALSVIDLYLAALPLSCPLD